MQENKKTLRLRRTYERTLSNKFPTYEAWRAHINAQQQASEREKGNRKLYAEDNSLNNHLKDINYRQDMMDDAAWLEERAKQDAIGR